MYPIRKWLIALVFVSTGCSQLVSIAGTAAEPSIIAEFIEQCREDPSSEATRRLGSQLLESAKAGNQAFFSELDSEARRIRTEMMPGLDERGARVSLSLINSTLVSAEVWSPTVLEFSEETLADPNTQPDFLADIVLRVPSHLALARLSPASMARRHNYPSERVVDFLVQAAQHPNKKVHDTALFGLTGYRVGMPVTENLMEGWSKEAAIPILRHYAAPEGRSFKDRVDYLEWLIVLEPPDVDHYVDVFRDYVLNPQNPFAFRVSYGERLLKHGYVSEVELEPAREEQRSFREKHENTINKDGE